jgi:hypothetical protein
MMKSYLSCFLVVIPILAVTMNPVEASEMIIDNRSTGTLQSSHAGEWRLITDQVMGGRSSGVLVMDQYLGRNCLRMRGSVSTANNGGFVQIALDLAAGKSMDASNFTGLVLEMMGNGERYNIHLRTSELWLPWQSYRADFSSSSKWDEIRLPFSEFEPYKTKKRLDAGKLVRIGVVAIGRQFEADLCLGKIAFYNDDSGD